METPISTIQVSAQTRVYYIDTYTDRKGQPYIAISEIPTEKSPGNQKRNRIFIHSANIEKFMEALSKAAGSLKAINIVNEEMTNVSKC